MTLHASTSVREAHVASKGKTTKTTTRGTKSAATKLDLYAKHKNEYVASSTRPGMVRVGAARYLSVPGKGLPGSDEFQGAIGALYTTAFTLKIARKRAGRDHT